MAANFQLQPIDPTVWHACAGPTSKIPSIGAIVYYFPSGHAECSLSPPRFSALAQSQPFILCSVAAVELFAHWSSDEVFARMHLVPLPNQHDPALQQENGDGDDNGEEDHDEVVSVAKVLRVTDTTNSGGGFVIPRLMIDNVFPELDVEVENEETKTLSVKDVHGVTFEFRHVCRGRKHVLTTGWSSFVNHKRLGVGDAVVFVRDGRTGERHVGIRRGEVGRVLVERVEVEVAVERGVRGAGFSVEYYPRRGESGFVVEVGRVREAMGLVWREGMRVRMAVEKEDATRMLLFLGTVDAVLVTGSPWRMLQIKWDEYDVLPSMKQVSPWEVEYVGPKPLHFQQLPLAKRPRVPPKELPLLPDAATTSHQRELHIAKKPRVPPELLPLFPDGSNGAQIAPTTVTAPSMMGNFNCIMDFNRFHCVDGIQPNVSNFVHDERGHWLGDMSINPSFGVPKWKKLFPCSPKGVRLFGSELKKQDYVGSFDVGSSSSTRLFGTVIHTK